MAIKPQTDYWHWFGGNKATNWPLTPILLTPRRHGACVPVLYKVSCGRPVSMFSVDNLFLVPYKWWSENLPKAQACFFIRNGKTAIGEGLYATLAIFTSVLQPESHWQELKIPSASSWYFIKRSKLNNLCPGSGHYTDQVLWWHAWLGHVLKDNHTFIN